MTEVDSEKCKEGGQEYASGRGWREALYGSISTTFPASCVIGNSLITSFLPPEEGPQMPNVPPNDQQEQLWARYHPSSVLKALPSPASGKTV